MASITTDRLDGVNTAVAIKAPVVVATTANITLSGARTIDGVAVVAGDRVLVKDQTTATENGIYVVETSTWTRAKDFDGNRDVVTGTLVYVQSGTDNGGGWFRQTTTGTITIGTSNIVWAALAFNVAALYSTSTTSLAVGTGSKSFTVSSGRAWLAGQRLRAADSTSAYVMEGEITSYSGTSLVLDVDYTEGSGTNASWNIGLAGARGATGATGATGAAAPFTWNFASSTTMADPSSGNFRLNNATLSSVTAIAIADNTGDSGAPDASVFVLAWDDSTNTSIRGTLILRKASAVQNFAVYNITGASTDNVGWTQLSVTYVTGAGSFSAADNIIFYFERAGDKGADGAGAGDFSSNTATSVDGEIVLFSGTGGKTGKRATTTGLLKAASGVLSAAVSGTDYAPATSGSSILKGNGSGGFSAAVADTDYAANAFKTIAVSGQSDVVADSASDTLTLAAGSNITITTNAGTDTITIAASAASGLTLLSTATASASATIDLETTLDSTYEAYVITISNLLPATDASILRARFNVGGYQTTSYLYVSQGNYSSTNAPNTQTNSTDDGATAININPGVTLSNVTAEPFSAVMYLHSPSNTSAYKVLHFEGGYFASSASTWVKFSGSGSYVGSTSAVTGLRFLMDSGNITSGEFKLYGLRKTV